jgi:hypothetical protein
MVNVKDRRRTTPSSTNGTRPPLEPLQMPLLVCLRQSVHQQRNDMSGVRLWSQVTQCRVWRLSSSRLPRLAKRERRAKPLIRHAQSRMHVAKLCWKTTNCEERIASRGEDIRAVHWV